MYQWLANGIANFFVRKDIITKERQEIYAFGLEQLVAEVFGILLLLVVSLLAQAVPEACVFYVTFMLVRKYTGGYHATTYVGCNVGYLATFLLCVLVARFSPDILLLCALLFACVSVCLLAPIEHPNNPIRAGAWTKYYRYAVIINISLGMIALVLYVYAINIYQIVVATMLAAAVYMYVEILKRRKGIMFTITEKFCKLVAEKAEKKAQSTRREVSMHRLHQSKPPKALLEDEKGEK